MKRKVEAVLLLEANALEGSQLLPNETLLHRVDGRGSDAGLETLVQQGSMALDSLLLQSLKHSIVVLPLSILEVSWATMQCLDCQVG